MPLPVTKEEGARAGQSQFPQPEPVLLKPEVAKLNRAEANCLAEGPEHQMPRGWGRDGEAWGVKRTGSQAAFPSPSLTTGCNMQLPETIQLLANPLTVPACGFDICMHIFREEQTNCQKPVILKSRWSYYEIRYTCDSNFYL